MNGILVAGGPGIERGGSPTLLRILDLCPTALALLGIEVPRSLDGVPMSQLLSCDHGWTDELPARPDSRGSDSEGDDNVLEERLRNIGYIAT